MAGNKKPIPFGSYNPAHGPLVGHVPNPREDTLYGSLSTMWSKITAPDIFAGIFRWQGVIIREEPQNEKTIGSPSQTNNTHSPTVTGEMLVRRFKVLIPELHSYLPKIASTKDHHEIGMLPTTEAIGIIAKAPLAVGTKVWVSFHNQASWTNPYITEIISTDPAAFAGMMGTGAAGFVGSVNTVQGKFDNYIKPVAGPLRTTPPAGADGFRTIKQFYQNVGPYKAMQFHHECCHMPCGGAKGIPKSNKNYKAKKKDGRQHGGTIRSAGCGPTNLATCMASYGLNVDPKVVGDALIAAGHRKCYNGSNPFAPEVVKALSKGQLKAERISWSRLLKELSAEAKDGKKGKCVVAHAKRRGHRHTPSSKGHFTAGGHYISITGYKGGKIRVNNSIYSKNWRGDRWVPASWIKTDCYRFFLVDFA